MDAGGMPSLMRLLSADIETLRTRVSLCLFTMTKSFDVRLKLRGDTAVTLIDQLMPLLSPQASPVAHENARFDWLARGER